MTSLGKRLVRGAKEAAAIAKGEADPATYKVHVPTDIDVGDIRRGLGMTQAAFASAFGISAGTIRDWEQGRVRPDTAARVLLMVIRHEPEAVRRTFARHAELTMLQTRAIERIAS